MEILDNLVNKKDALVIIQTAINITNNETAARTLRSIYNAVNQMKSINVVQAGDINIICDSPAGFEEMLKKHKDK